MVAVTGANGLVGSFVVRKLIDANEPFVALKRAGSDTSLLDDVAHKIAWREADVLDPVQLEEALEGVTRVIHSSAIVSYNPRRATQVMDTNVRGTRNIINECLSREIKRFVHVSSVAALGRQRNQRVVDESNQWIDNPMHSVYAKSKYLAELEVFRAHQEGMSTVIINPSLVLAAADWNKSSGQLFKYVWTESKVYTDGSLNYVDVRDVASVTYTLLNEISSGERYIVNAGKISFQEFFEKVARRFNKKPPSVKLGATLLNIAARAETFRTWLTGEEPILTRETARLSGSNFFYDNTKIKKALSIEFQPIDASLDWCCNYYLEKYQHKK